MNTLYYGNNLPVLQRYIPDESVDLIYLDPPFNSNATYNVLFAEQNGSRAAAQIEAFGDTWRWDKAAAASFQEAVEQGGDVARVLRAFRMYLGDSNMLAYLATMAPRLVELRRVLKPTGSIYLHCDPTASHYLKILMDAVFSARNFRNEIIWCYSGGGLPKKDFPRKHDIVLRFTKDIKAFRETGVFNVERKPFAESTQSVGIHSTYAKKYGSIKIDLERGTPITDWWTDIKTVTGWVKERLGYPTQKPEALLERIIRTSSNEDDLVLDPFCGCGTAIAVAQRLNRRWIGIDITHLAITLIKHRLRNAFGELTYRVIGEPVSLPDARTLAAENPYQFQWWALGLVGARPVQQKKGSDRGIDGRIYFHEGAKGKTKQVILSVKAGHTGVADVRDLRGVVEREKAQIGVLITMQEPTRPMRTEAAGAGFYESPWGKHLHLQILTIAELLAGRGIDMPPIRQVSTTFKKAPRAKGDKAQTRTLSLE